MRAESAEASAGGEEVRISVEDKGLGISSQELPHVFDPFFRGKQATSRQIRGTGLGLSLARDAVVAMGRAHQRQECSRRRKHFYNSSAGRGRRRCDHGGARLNHGSQDSDC